MRRSRVHVRFATAVALLLATLGAPVAAQTIRGAVRDSVSGEPVAGAGVLLLDSARTSLGRTTTDEQGQYRLVLTSGARTLRVTRIGFQPRVVKLQGLPGTSSSIDIGIERTHVTFASVHLEANPLCPHRDDGAPAAALWGRARAGLLATVVAQQENLASVRRYSFERTLDGKADRISRFVVTPDSADGDAGSYSAVMSPADFVKFGFSTDSDGTLAVYRPDAEVLADDAFAVGYCFHLADLNGAHRGEAGVAFTPADRRSGRVDIDGTLWLDTVAQAVRSIEYRYVGLPDRTAPFRPGGLISFHLMPNGAVLVDRWQVRHPEAALDTLAAFPAWDVHTRSWLYATESGSELARVTWPDGRSWRAPLGTLRVHAVTGAGQPAANVLLVLPGTSYRGTTDISGDLVIPDLIPGPYTVESVDPRVAALGIPLSTPEKFVAARDSTNRVTMKVTTVDEYVIRHCIDANQWSARDSVFVLGRVQSPSGEPIGDAKVTFAVKNRAGKWKSLGSDFTTAADGEFQECNPALAVGADVQIRIRRPGVEDVVATAALRTKLTVVVVPVLMLP